jgi:hypothetical protein
MRLRILSGWAVTILLASVGCGQAKSAASADLGEGNDAGTGGGGSDDDDDPQAMNVAFARSGSRLVAMGFSSNEARVFRTFHDQQLGFDCDFAPGAADVDQRCVPARTVEVVYTDADCSQPATWSVQQNGWESGDAVSGLATPLPLACPGDAPLHRDAYRIGEQLSDEMVGSSPIDVFSVRDGQCQTAPLPGKVAPPVYRLIPFSETELARGERVSLNVGAGLRLTRLIADDGAELSLGVTGSDRIPCELQRDGECVPQPIARYQPAASGTFSTALNADCTEPAFVMPYPEACGPARFGVFDDGIAPPAVWSLEKASTAFSWQLVLPVSNPPSYSCGPLPEGDRTVPMAPARELTGTLPTASKLRRGAGPLHVDWYITGDNELGPALVPAAWGSVWTPQFVDDDGNSCQITAADSGKYYCVPPEQEGELTTFPEVTWGPI